LGFAGFSVAVAAAAVPVAAVVEKVVFGSMVDFPKETTKWCD